MANDRPLAQVGEGTAGALAAAAVGDGVAATAHADRALALADAWDLPAYRDWLLAHRARLGV